MDYEFFKIKMYKAYDNDSMLMHFHNGYEIIFVEKGGVNFTIDGINNEYGCNTLIFINNLERHDMTPKTTPYSRYVIIIDADYFDKFIKDPVLCSIFKSRAGAHKGFILSPEMAKRIIYILDSCLREFERKDFYWETGMMSMLLNMFIDLYRNYKENFPVMISDHTAKHVAKVQIYIDKNYLDELSLEGLSASFNINKYHLSHLFKKVTGYTVKQYILLKRISHAKNLLYYTDEDISQIASNSGFNSASNFIRAFKAHEKLTPLSFRKSFEEKDL